MSKSEKEIVTAVLEDFKKRQEARRPVELNWRLNMNFVIGKGQKYSPDFCFIVHFVS